MTAPDMRHIKSGGRRLDFYAELGRYFSANGRLRQDEFRKFLRGVAATHTEQAPGDMAAARAGAARWLSGHLEEVLVYLEERGLDAAALELFEATLDECAQLGLQEVTLSPARLHRLVSRARRVEAEPPVRRRDPDAKRRKIFDAALEVFIERGYYEATIDEIAARSMVAKGTVYRYFSSKEDLLDQLLKDTSRRVGGRFAAAFNGEKDVLDQIEAFVRQWVAFIEENHTLYRLIQNEGINGPSGRQTIFYEYLIADFPMIKEHVAALDAAGVLKTVNFHTVAYGVLGFVDGVARKWFQSGMEYPLSDELPVILEVLFNGFVGDNAARRAYFTPPEPPKKS